MFKLFKKLERSGVVYSSRRCFNDEEQDVGEIVTYIVMKEYSHVNFFTNEKKITRTFEIKQGGGTLPGYGGSWDYNVNVEKTNAEQWVEKHRYDEQLKYLE